MIINVKSSVSDYSVVVENGCLNKLSEFVYNNGNKTLLVTDDGVPKEYCEIIRNQLNITDVHFLNRGEINKNWDSVSEILKTLCAHRFCRSDRIIALGGGVVGDLAGFAASVYMRGIELINIPTTLLSQVDSSIGGKTGFDFAGIKNLIGSFYPPKKVIIDPLLTQTQNNRDFNCGMVEALKMSLCFDKVLYNDILSYNDISQLQEIIIRSLLIKKHIVEEDEKESGKRKILNFGHTIGHAIELSKGNKLLHGECVALGMLAFVPDNIKKELIEVYRKWNIPYSQKIEYDSVLNNVLYDKKANREGTDIIFLTDCEKPLIKTVEHSELKKIVKEYSEGRMF